MNIKAISKTLLIVIIAVIIIIAGVAAFFLFQPQEQQITATVNLEIRAPTGKTSGDNAEFELYSDSANKTFKVGDVIKIVLTNNFDYPLGQHAFSLSIGGKQIAQISASTNGKGEITIKLDTAGTVLATCLTFCGAWHTVEGKMVNVPIFNVSS